jgi:hypothetical protein
MNFQKYTKGYKKDLIQQIVFCIEHSESFTLLGIHGIGKTSLLNDLNENFKFWKEVEPNKVSDFLFVFIDLTKLLDATEIGFYRLFLSCLYRTVVHNIEDKLFIKKVFTLYKSVFKEQDLLILYEAIGEIIRYVTEEKKLKISFVIDDFSSLSSFDKEFFNSLKAVRNINKWKITFVFCSDRDISKLFDPRILDELYNIFLNRQFWFKPLSEKDTYLVLEEIAREENIPITKKVKKQIYILSGGHSGYIKTLNSIFQNFKTNSIKLTKQLKEETAIQARSENIWLKLSSEHHSVLLDFVQNTSIPLGPRERYLINTGLICIRENSKNVFSLIFEDFIMAKINNKDNLDIKEETKGIYIDPLTDTIYIQEKLFDKKLTPHEYQILKLLYKNKGEVVTRENIAAVLWNKKPIKKHSDWAIDKAISRLRKKLGDTANLPAFIKTIKGKGIKLIHHK